MDYKLVQLATDLAADLGLHGAVAYYVAVAQFLKIPLATLDNDQSIRASKIITTFTKIN